MEEDKSEFEEILPCSEKLAFDTKKDALATAAAVEYQRGTKLKPYLCKDCKLWHLASDYKN